MVDPYQDAWTLSRLKSAGFVAGSRVAGYKLEEEIGSGGMAVVFRAHDEHLQRQVAMKILAPALAADQEFRRRFIRESRAAAAVDDPHIIPVFEAGEAEGILFITMRYVPGGDVRTLLCREGPLSPARAMAIISPVASALDAAHAVGLVHRDVKPANMLVDARPGRPNHVYLSDFGLSKGVSSAGPTRSGQFLGTPDYSAPEQIEGKPVDGRADQYSLACVAFELLCGEAPFPREHLTAVIWAHMSESAPMLTSRRPDLPPGVDSVLAKALAKAPGDRHASCREFADALRDTFDLAPYNSASGRSPLVNHPRAETTLPARRKAAEGKAPAQSSGPVPDALLSAGRTDENHIPVGHPGPGEIPAEASKLTRGTGIGQEMIGRRQRRPPIGTMSPSRGSGPTVIRSQNREQALTGTLAPAPEPSGRGRTRRRDRRRAAVLALPAALVMLAAAFGALLTRSPHSAPKAPSPQPTASYSFGPEQYRDGLLIVRRWTLSGRDGSLLTETVTASSATGKAARVKFTEPIPAAIAYSLQSVRFKPAPSRIIQADPLVQWDLSLPARGTIDVGYQAAVGPAGATQTRLAQWAKQFHALQVSLNLPRPITIGVRSLAISPSTLRLGRGASAPLTLKGLLSNGQAAPRSLLAGAVWSTSNSAVAVVDITDAVVAVDPGTAVITAQLGTARTSATVTVTGTSNPAAQGTNPTASRASSSPARVRGPSSPSSPGGGGVSSSSPSTAPAPPPQPCTPKIATVGAFEANGSQTVTITGSCFGAGNTTSAADTAYFELSDLTTGWAACFTDGHGEDWVTCNISSWTDNEITFSGYTGYYGQDGFVVTNGQDIEVQVWNPQSGNGPATCLVVAGSGSATNCPGS